MRSSLFPFTRWSCHLLTAAVFLCAANIANAQSPAPLTGDHIATSQGDLVTHPVKHASFVMQWNGKTIYVDPVGGAEPYAGLPGPDLVLITDIHPDHLNADTLADMKGTSVVAPQAVYDQAPDNIKHMITTILKNGDQVTVDGIGIEAMPMYNITEGRLQYHEKGRGNGYLLTLGDERVYIAGDTEAIPEMLALEDIDVAFIPMNLPYTMTVEQAAEAVRTFRPVIVYPYHYRGSDVEEFRRLVGDASEVRLLEWY
jgi:L-ascorbate metabolism protein UlaG (beta-lactamase superfamily)